MAEKQEVIHTHLPPEKYTQHQWNGAIDITILSEGKLNILSANYADH